MIERFLKSSVAKKLVDEAGETESYADVKELFADLQSNPPYTRGLWRLKKFLPKRPERKPKTLLRFENGWEFYLTNPHILVLDIYRESKYFVQRGLHGYCEKDVWSLNYYLSSWLPEALRELAAHNHGCAPELFDRDADDNECHKWEAILIEIAEGLEAYRNRDKHDLPEYTAAFAFREPGSTKTEDPELIQAWRVAEQTKQAAIEEKTKRSLELLAQWFPHLWD